MSTLQKLQKLGAINEQMITVQGETFRVRSLSAGQRYLLQQAMRDGGLPEHLVVAHGLLEDDGKPLIHQPEAAAQMLAALDGGLVSELSNAILKLSGMMKKSVEDAEKN